MTKLALTFAFLASSFAHAAQVIARYDYNAGFSLKPGSEYVEIYNNGSVRFHSEYYDRQTQKMDVKDYRLAVLRLGQIKAMTSNLAIFKESDLIDEDAGKPMCTDAPSTEYSVFQGKKKVVITRYSGCHTWKNDGAQQVKEVLEGLAVLANY
jgi:hypothetical protein